MPGSRVLGGGLGGAGTRSRERQREHHSHRGSRTTLHPRHPSFSIFGVFVSLGYFVGNPFVMGILVFQRDQVLSGEDRI